MALLVATREGVYRTPGVPIDDAERVLASGDSPRVHRLADDRVYAATGEGLFRSTDGGTWENLGVPRTEVYSVALGPDGERLYAGTHPAHLYVSTDDGDSWSELDGFQDLPSRGDWHTPRHRNEAHVRSLGVHPDAPDRLVAGVEVGGVHVSDDCGETWTERREGVNADVHHVLVRSPEEYVASCGDGLYRTTDAGRSWTRLDGAVEPRYFREAFAHERTLYAAAARGPPGTWDGNLGADAALYESADGGRTLAKREYPGAPEEVVLAWTTYEGRLVAGTNDGRILERADDGWRTAGEVPAYVRSLAPV